ncbi:LigB family dioxygenase [Serratia rubidaea]|uniref:LigB family dioxygenase n=1 Tax=Serratia rubidaea TaxID=61652 RepID=A0A3S4HZN2_SERRU|nr:LigB family dioxygenase [Serratia rubidaea]
MTISRMPALFLGHGSPMNVLEENRYTETWRRLGESLRGRRRSWPFPPIGTPAAPR